MMLRTGEQGDTADHLEIDHLRMLLRETKRELARALEELSEKQALADRLSRFIEAGKHASPPGHQ